MTDKKLTISVDAKISPALQSLSRMLDDFAVRGNKVAKAFQGISGTDPATKQGGLAKALLAERKLFEDLGSSGVKLSKILNEQVSRSQTALKRQLEDSTKSLETLIRKHESAQARVSKLKNAGAPQGAIDRAVGVEEGRYNQILSGVAQQQQAKAAVEALKSPGVLSSIKGITSGIATSIIGAGASTLAIGSAMQGAVGTFQSYYNAPYAARAALGQAMAPGMAAGLQGDIASAVAMQEALNDPDRDSRMYWAKEGAKLESGMTVLKSVLPKFLGGNSFAQGMGAIRGFQENQATALVQQDIERQQQLMAARPDLVARVQYLQNSAGSNVSMMREMGLDPTSLQNIRERSGQQAQLDIGQSDALFRSLAGVTGTVGARAAMQNPGLYAALKGGLSQQTAVGLAAAGQLSGTDLLGLGTDYDRTLQNMVGNQVAGAMLDPSRLLSRGGGAGYMGQLYAGVGGGRMGADELRIVQQNMLGDQAFANMGGASPLQQSMNLANAVGILGKRGQHNVLAQSKLSEVFKDPALLANVMAGGALPGQWQGVGLRREDIKEFTQDTLRQAAMSTRRFGGNLPGTKAIDKLIRGEHLNEQEAEQAGGILGTARPDLFTDVTGTAFARRAAGLRAGAGVAAGGGRERVDAAAGSVELKSLDVTIKNMVTNLGKLGGATDEVAHQISKAAAAISASTSWLRTSRSDAMDFSQRAPFIAEANSHVYDLPRK